MAQFFSVFFSIIMIFFLPTSHRTQKAFFNFLKMYLSHTKKKSQISLGSSMEHDNLMAAYSSPNKVFEIVSPLFCTSYLKSPRSVGEAK